MGGSLVGGEVQEAPGAGLNAGKNWKVGCLWFFGFGFSRQLKRKTERRDLRMAEFDIWAIEY